MASTLKGSAELRAKLKAIRTSFKPIGRTWAETAVDVGRPMVPNRTGRLRRSFRVRNATQRKAVVGGHYTGYFVDAGTKAHAIVPKKAPRLAWTDGGRTIFARKVNHPRTRAQPFRMRMALESLRRNPMAVTLIRLWNAAKR